MGVTDKRKEGVRFHCRVLACSWLGDGMVLEAERRERGWQGKKSSLWDMLGLRSGISEDAPEVRMSGGKATLEAETQSQPTRRRHVSQTTGAWCGK